ncbi:MAG: WYL domain-containing protein [Actinomycetota bacterium]
MNKVERLVNLIALLLNTRHPLTVEEIRNTVPGYQQQDYSSFKRMFERDKEELRSLGIPIERRFTDVWEVEEGYLISKERYYLPELDLDPDEMAALWIASQIVVEPGGKEDQALVKLSLLGDGSADPSSPPWLRARLHLDAPALPQVLEGVAQRRRIRFRYRAANQSKDTERTVDPYALVHRQGSWHVVGHDHLRGSVRNFKLPRMTSKVTFVSRSPGPDFDIPEGFSADQGAQITEPWAGDEDDVKVQVAFSPRIAWWIEQSQGLKPSGTWKDWTVVEVSVGDDNSFASWVLSFGEDAVVRSPQKVRALVVSKLEEAAKAARPSAPKATKKPGPKKPGPKKKAPTKR